MTALLIECSVTAEVPPLSLRSVVGMTFAFCHPDDPDAERGEAEGEEGPRPLANELDFKPHLFTPNSHGHDSRFTLGL